MRLQYFRDAPTPSMSAALLLQWEDTSEKDDYLAMPNVFPFY